MSSITWTNGPNAGGEHQAVTTRGEDKIAVLVDKFPRLSMTFVLHEFLELRRQGLPLRLLAVRDPREPVCQPEVAALRGEVTYLRTGQARRRVAVRHALRRHPRGVGRGLRWLARQRTPRKSLRRLVDALVLVRVCYEEGLRHVHAHSQSAPVAYLAQIVAGVPFSFTAHAADVYMPEPRALASQVAAARAVVTCTDTNRAYFEQTVGVPPGTVRVMRHGIPLQAFLDVTRAPVPGRLLTVGRVVPIKGHDVIAHALAQLVADGRDLHWHVAGLAHADDRGRYRAELTGLVAELGLADRVRFLGGVPAEQVRAELAAAQAFVLAPRVLADGSSDGIPNVLLEAMAAGVPVVTTAVSGIPEVIHDGQTGLLVAPDDPSALAAALARLLNDKALCRLVVDQARGWAVEHCDLGRCVAPLAALLRELATGSPPGRIGDARPTIANNPSGAWLGSSNRDREILRHSAVMFGCEVESDHLLVQQRPVFPERRQRR